MNNKDKLKNVGNKIIDGVGKSLEIISSGLELIVAICDVCESVNNANYSAKNFKNNISNNNK